MSSPEGEEVFTSKQEAEAAERLFSAEGRMGFSALMDVMQQSGYGTQAGELEARYDDLFLEGLGISVDDQGEGDKHD